MQGTKSSVLLIEDEENIARLIAAVLRQSGYRVVWAGNGADALRSVNEFPPEIILLDLGLPDIDGTEILEKAKGWTNIPIIVISARDSEQDKVEALDLGADDYITKPFGNEELLARMRTALRHKRASFDEDLMKTAKFTCGGLSIDFGSRIVMVDGEKVHLTQIEFKIVQLLCKYAGRVLTYDYILKQIWGPYAGSDNKILRVNMANIRRKLEKNPAEPRYIFTEAGVGYKMAAGK